MSRTWRRRATTESVVDEVMCNVCRAVFKAGVHDEEIENCIFIVKTYGYDSKFFGDQTSVNIDICESCAHKMFGHMTEAISEYREPWLHIRDTSDDTQEDLTTEPYDVTISFRR